MEGDVPELHGAGLRRIGPPALVYAGIRIEHLVYALRADLGRGQEHYDNDQHHDGHDDIGGIGAENDDVAEALQPCRRISRGNGVYQRRAHPVDDQGEGVHAQGNDGHQEGEGPLVEELCAHQPGVGLLKLAVLVVLGVICVHHIDTGQVLVRDLVYAVGELLHAAEPRQHQADDYQHNHQQRHNEARRDDGELPALVYYLDDGPHRHDGRLYDELQAHGYHHLHLGDVVGRAVDEAGHGEAHHLMLAEVGDLVEDSLAHSEREAGRHLCGQVAADYAERGARQRAAEHLKTCVEDVRHGAAGGLNEDREVAHIVGQLQVKVYLAQYQHRAEQRHEDVAAA